jgi:hypothetical protein
MRFSLRLPPPCGVVQVLRWHRQAPRIRLSPLRQRHRAPRFQLGVRREQCRRRLLRTQWRRYRRIHRRREMRGARPAPSHRRLRRGWRLFLGGRSGSAPSQKQRRLPSLGCCPALIRLSRRPRRRSCGSGRRSRPSTSASVIGAPSWRSALRSRPANSPWSDPSLSGSARSSRRTSRRCLTRSGR